jgi:ABC-type transport system, involved in lipoprotein release, permease component
MLVGHLFRHFIFSPRAGALVRRIAWLAIVGICISTIAFLVVLFVMNGMNGSIKGRIMALEPHLYVTVAGARLPSSLESHPVFQRLKDIEDSRVQVFEAQDVIVRSQDGQFRGGIARGVTQESLALMIQKLQEMDSRKIKTPGADGGFFWNPDDVPERGEIIMGIDLAQSLGVFEGDFVTVVSPEGLLLPPGETPKFERVRIKKIIATSLADIDAQYIFYQRGKSLGGISTSTTLRLGIEAFLPEDANLDSMKKDLQKFSDVQVETWMDRNSALLYALWLEKLTIGMVLGFAGFIAGSAILTVLVLLVSQKRRDIAILRTIGLSARRTILIFTQMGFLLAASGLVSGVFIGTAVSYYIQKNPIQFLPSEVYYDSSIPALVDFGLAFGVLIVGLGLAWLGSYVPARATAEESPSQALRSR